jgi:hypothetical protein
MGIKTTYVDDIDGSDLGEKAQPTTFSLDGKSYSIYLTPENKAKLADALDLYIKNGVSGAAVQGNTISLSETKERVKAVRAWAQSTGTKFKAADGTMKTVGDKGRIPDEIFAAYDEAN